MKVLALSTARREVSVALLEDEHPLWEVSVSDGRQHSETLLPIIDYILGKASLRLASIDLFACVTGPGSFTGLRVGLATVKGMAMVQRKPVVGVSTLEAIAFASAVEGIPICVLMNARPGYVYAGVYRLWGEGKLVSLGEERFCLISQLFAHLPPEPILFIGDGSETYRQEIKEQLKERAVIGGWPEGSVRGSAVGILGYRKFKAGVVLDPLLFAPHYLQVSSAERKVDKERPIGLRKD